MTEPTQRRRVCLWLIAAGLVFALCALLTVLLVMVDKSHFGGLVGWAFLPVITSGVIVGGLMMLVGSLFLPERWSWRGITLIVWALIAATSPLFGYLFLLPWGLLAVSAPLVIWIVAAMFRAPVSAV